MNGNYNLPRDANKRKSVVLQMDLFGGCHANILGSPCALTRCGGQPFEYIHSLNNKAAHNSYARCPLGCERETTGEIAAAACSFL